MSDIPGRQASISAMMAPRTILIVGASAKRTSSGNEALANLLEAGFPADSIYLVHPTAEMIAGLPVHSSIASLPIVPDVALLAIPPAALADALADLAAIGCPAAIIPGAGLTADEQTDLRRAAAASSVGVVGNNCMGVLSITDRTPLWFYEGILTDLPTGPIALVSQSGSATFLARAVEGVGFSRIISTGNEIDLNMPDYLTWLADDPATSVVGLVLETVWEPDRFAEAIAVLRAAGKPVVALKVGSTVAGARATVAHTGAVVSSASAVESFFARLDVPLVHDYDELALSLQALASAVRPLGPRIAVVTDSGGEAALAADLAESSGIEVPDFTPETVHKLERLVPHAIVGNPFDAGASPLTTDEEYDEAFGVVAEDPNVDAIAVILEAHASAPEREVRFGMEMMGGAIAKARRAGKPVVAVSSSTIATHPLARETLGEVPLLRGVKPALVALRAASGNRRPLPVCHPRPAGLPQDDDVRRLRDLLATRGPGTVSARDARTVLSAYGIEMVEATVATSLPEALAWASGRFPVVAKVASTDIAHRTDIGAVKVGIADARQLESAYREIMRAVSAHAADAVIDGVEIQVEAAPGHEALVGLTSDPQFGSTVVVGSGGVLVELLDDVKSSLVPVSAAEAQDLVEATTLNSLMAGYRAIAAPTPVEPLVDLIVRLSWLGQDFAGVIDELDLNPVLIQTGTGRLQLVDVLITVAHGGPNAVTADPVPQGAHA